MEGRKCKGYYNTGTRAIPVWAVLKRTTEWKRSQSRATSDVAGRPNSRLSFRESASNRSKFCLSYLHEHPITRRIVHSS